MIIIKPVYRSPAEESGEDLSVGRGDTLDELIADEAKPIEAPVEAPVAPEAPVEAPPRDPDTGKFVPKARFDEQLGKERLARETAERKYAELETKLGQVSRSEDISKLEAGVTEMEKQHAKLLLDGNHEKASEIMRDIRLTERKIALQESNERMKQTAQETRESIKMDMVIERLEATHSVLNPAAEDYNPELVEEVLGWQSVYMERYRLSPSAALQKASDKVMAGQSAPAAVAPQKGLSAAQTGVSDRKQAQVGKNVAAAAAQPAALKGVGQDNGKFGAGGKIDVASMSMEDFDALPESMRAQLRGDLVS